MALPFIVYATIFMVVVAVATWMVARKLQRSDDQRWMRIGALTAAGLAVLLLVFSCFTMVGTRKIGVLKEFGKPVDSLSNGIHLKWPWQTVSELDGAIQTDSHVGNAEDDSTRCTDIRIGNESTACVDNTIRWQIITEKGQELDRDYRNMDNIRESLVTRELNAALNQVLGNFNPLDAVEVVNADEDENVDEGVVSAADLESFAAEATAIMQERVGDKITVLSITIPLIRYDNNTQERLNAYQAEVANTRIAQQREQTAAADARANEALADSVSNDPYVLVARCMDTFAVMVEQSQPVPAGFNCWPGSQSAIVVPSASPATSD